jgi:hypothetical protein
MIIELVMLINICVNETYSKDRIGENSFTFAI